MGSSPEFLRVLLPRAGVVAPNGALVLEGHVLEGAPVLAVRAGGVDLAFAVEPASWFSYERLPSRGTVYLVRPTAGEWPAGGVTIRGKKWNLEAKIGTVHDDAAPAFASLGAPIMRTSRPSHGPFDVMAIDHGGFDDRASPIVLVTIEFDGEARAGWVPEGHAGTLTMPPRDVGHVGAIILGDTAGNTRRIPEPTGPRRSDPLFTCVAGTLTLADGTFVAVSDGGTANGWSRGHYLTSQTYEADMEIAVTVERLTDEHEMPIEIAFGGGFFGVTGTSQFYIYEHDGHWTGWLPTPVPVGAGPMRLKVQQRGQSVLAFVDDKLAGSLVLEKPAQASPVGIHFKGRPATASRIGFRDFVARTGINV